MTQPLVLTVPEVADLLRVSADSVYDLCSSNELDHRRVGRRIIIPRRAVLEFLGEEVGPPPAQAPETAPVIPIGRRSAAEGAT